MALAFPCSGSGTFGPPPVQQPQQELFPPLPQIGADPLTGPPCPPPLPPGGMGCFGSEPPGPPDCPPPKGPPPPGMCFTKAAAPVAPPSFSGSDGFGMSGPAPCPPMMEPIGPPPPAMLPADPMVPLMPGPPLLEDNVPPGFPPGFPFLAPTANAELPPSDSSFGGEPPQMMGPELPPGPPPGCPPDAMMAGHTAASSSQAGTSKRRSNKVDGLASAKNIKSGGSVTVYDGYVATATAAKPAVGSSSSSTAVPNKAGSATAEKRPGGAVRGTEALPRQLPPGWEMKMSKSTGKVYYVNVKEGKTQWEPPAGSSMQAPAATAPEGKKRKAAARAQDAPDAQLSSKNGVKGLVRATHQHTGRWQKWQKTSQILNTEEEDDGPGGI